MAMLRIHKNMTVRSTHTRTHLYSVRGREKCTETLISIPLLYSKAVGNTKITKKMTIWSTYTLIHARTNLYSVPGCEKSTDTLNFDATFV